MLGDQTNSSRPVKPVVRPCPAIRGTESVDCFVVFIALELTTCETWQLLVVIHWGLVLPAGLMPGAQHQLIGIGRETGFQSSVQYSILSIYCGWYGPRNGTAA